MLEQYEEDVFLFKALQYMEAAKADRLKLAFNEGLALRSAGIPDILLDSLDDLSFRIGGLEVELYEQLEAEVTNEQIDSLKSQLFELKTAHQALIRLFEEKYPTYHQLTFGGNITDPETLQKALKEEGLLSYFYDDKKVYGVLLTSHEAIGFSMGHQGRLKDMIGAYRRLLNPQAALSMNESSQDDFQQLNDSLYQLLLGPLVQQEKLEDISSLAVVPHGAIHYLPIGVLYGKVEGDKSVKELPFLLQKMPIYYANAASLWSQTSPSFKHKKTYTGFAPSYQAMPKAYAARASFGNLNWNQEEVQLAHGLFGGDIYLGENASEANFLRVSADAGILHLSMHADVNDRTPMQSGLLFTPESDSVENGFLNLYEIYQQRIPAHTLILNACNTGYGKLAEGEGVMSLSHAFAYAGCRSMLLNLWLADDQASSQIVTRFFHYLNDGHAKHEALRMAKLDYLEDADPIRAHPYFWAGLVLQGEREIAKSSLPGWLVGILILGLCGGCFFFMDTVYFMMIPPF